MNKKIKQILIMAFATGSIIITSIYATNNDDSLKNQIKILKNKVENLEKALNQKNIQRKAASRRKPQIIPYSGYNQNPFFDLSFIQNEMQSFMNDDFINPLIGQSRYTDNLFNIDTDIKETKDSFIITIDIPGMDKSKINIETKGNNLIVSGNKTNSTEQKDPKNHYFRQERSFGSFSKSLILPKNADKENIKANYKNGVLSISIKKLKETETKNKKIKIN